MNQDYTESKNMNADARFPLFILTAVNEASYPHNKNFYIMHWHEDFQLIYVQEGSITLKTLTDDYLICEGEAVLINQNVVHMVTNREKCKYKSLLFPAKFVQFYPGSTAETNVNQLIQDLGSACLHFDVRNQNTYAIIQAVKEIIQLEEDTPYYEYRVLLLLCTIFLHIFRSENSHISKNSQKARRMNLFLKYIETHYQENISLADIAACASVSKSECLRCFKEILDQTPYEYLIEYRLAKAAHLLQSTDESITFIAFACGFAQPSHLGVYFKKKTGFTPRQYRTQSKKAE